MLDSEHPKNSWWTRLSAPFMHQGKPDPLLILLFIAIQALVLVNNVRHNPEMGYDAEQHLYILYVMPGRLPTPVDSDEWFSPPLPYLLPSLADKVCMADIPAPETVESINICTKAAGKVAQLINWFLSLGLGWLMLSTAGLMIPGSRWGKFSTLGLLAILTVYYKTFAQVRGEPYVAFFALLTVWLVFRLIQNRADAHWKNGIPIGLALGGLALSRQWGLMLFPALAGLAVWLWLVERRSGWRVLQVIFTAFAVSAIVAGWFYLYLYLTYGSLTAFNRQPTAHFSFSNQPRSFYRHFALDEGQLFTIPTRRSFDNLLFPIFYSDTWGDYWGYFVFIRDKSYLGELGYDNQAQITPYLGRVNLVSLIPSALFLAGVLAGGWAMVGTLAHSKYRTPNLQRTFLFLIGASTTIIYLYFLIRYPEPPQGTTIKPTYVLHALLMLPLLGADIMERLRLSWPRIYFCLMILLGLVFLHNLPAMITRYIDAP